MTQLNRQLFFDKIVKIENWKNSMAGKNEESVISAIKSVGFVLDKDFVRQYPIGERFVIDIAFVKEQIAIEVDGMSHNSKKQKSIDKKRDNYLKENNWITLRIKDKEFFGYKGSFYKSLIKEIVKDRRKQLYSGKLYAIDIPNFKEEDYE